MFVQDLYLENDMYKLLNMNHKNIYMSATPITNIEVNQAYCFQLCFALSFDDFW